MNIFVGGREDKPATRDLLLDAFQATDNFSRISRRDDPLARKHFRMGDAAGDVVTVKPRINIDGSRESLHRICGSGSKPAAPEFFSFYHFPCQFRLDRAQYGTQNVFGFLEAPDPKRSSTAAVLVAGRSVE